MLHFCSIDPLKKSCSAEITLQLSWWRFSIAVTRWSQSTQLHYIESG